MRIKNNAIKNGKPAFFSIVRRVGIGIYEFLTIRTFFARVWWALFLLSVAGAVVYVLVVAHVWTRFVQMRAQYGSWSVASHIAQKMEPLLTPLASDEVLTEFFETTNKVNPLLDLYLFQPQSKQLFSADGWRTSGIDTEAIEKFLNHRGSLDSPIEIDTVPLSGPSEEEERSFSAARVSIDGVPSYLVAILAGRRYQRATRVNRPGNLNMLGYSLFASVLIVPTILGIAVVFILTRRFNAMTGVVHSFQSGDYSQRISDTSTDELGIYARAFDQMADTIVENLDKTQRQNNLRRQLVANVSHELRRPLSLMSLSLETLIEKNTEWSPHTRREYLIQAVDGCEQMARLVNDLFELSKLNASEAPLQLDLCEVDEIADDVCAKFQKLATERELHLTTEYPDNLPTVLADVALLDRALSNLVENAIQYSSPHGTIVIELNSLPSTVEIRVHDQGRGIPPEELEHIFERFYQGGQTQAQNDGGAGLGLAIVKRIVEMHEQTIEAKSEVNEGSCFTFSLPLAITSEQYKARA